MTFWQGTEREAGAAEKADAPPRIIFCSLRSQKIMRGPPDMVFASLTALRGVRFAH